MFAKLSSKAILSSVTFSLFNASSAVAMALLIFSIIESKDTNVGLISNISGLPASLSHTNLTATIFLGFSKCNSFNASSKIPSSIVSPLIVSAITFAPDILSAP